MGAGWKMVGLDKRLCRRGCTRSVGGGLIRFGMMIRDGVEMCWYGVKDKARPAELIVVVVYSSLWRNGLLVLAPGIAGCGKHICTCCFYLSWTVAGCGCLQLCHQANETVLYLPNLCTMRLSVPCK